MSNNVSRLIQFVGQEVVAGRMLGDGISMTEAEFGEEFKVSRNVIREVVKVLISKGIIKSRQRIGIHRENVENWNWFDYDVFSWVARENASGRVMRSFFESRVIMQGDAAALSAQKFDSFHVQEYSQLVSRYMDTTLELSDRLLAECLINKLIFSASQNLFYIRFWGLVERAYLEGVVPCDPILMERKHTVLLKLLSALRSSSTADARMAAQEYVRLESRELKFISDYKPKVFAV